MKIELYMNFEKITMDVPAKDNIVPHASAKIEISEKEMDYMKRSHKELFEAITRLLNFTVQFMQ